MKNLDVHQSLASYVTVDTTQSVGQSLSKLRSAGKDFIMVTKKWNEHEVPVSVLTEPELMSLAAEENQKLDELLANFPAIFTADEDDLEDEYLSDVLTILGETKSQGLVVRLLDKSLGVVSQAAVARAVPLEEIVFVGGERAAGQVGIPPRTYICRQCTPERRKPARVGGPPDCDVWSHGPMEAE